MTRYFRDWEFDTIGSAASGLTRRGGGSHTMVPAYGTPPYKRAYAAQTTDNTGDYRSFSLDAVDADANRANANQVMLFKFDDATVEQVHLYCRGAGTSSVTDFYRVRLTLSSGALRIDKMAASAYTADIGTATVTVAAGKSYFVRFDAQSTALKAKVWDAALGKDGEPAAWDISITDASVSGAGWVAIGGRHTTLTGKVIPINAWAVASNGDSAIAPRTNAEFLAWISKPNLRCVLAELPATGYDSGGSPYTKTVRAYVSNIGYTSQQQDSPSLQHYDAYIASIPTFSRQMGADLVGPVSVGFGDLVLKNKAGGTRKPGKAVSFDGSNDLIDFGNNASLTSGLTGDMTLEGWFLIQTHGGGAMGQNVLVSGRRTEVFQAYDLCVTSSVIGTQIHGGGGAGSWQNVLVSGLSIPAGVPVHIGWTRSGTSVKFYMNGVQVGTTQTVTVGTLDAGDGMLMGKSFYGGAQFKQYYADEVRIWNVARTDAQMLAYYNKRATGTETGLVAWWPFDEGFGTTTDDCSSNSNVGTFGAATAAPTWISGFAPFPPDETIGRLDDWLRVSWRRDVVMRMWIGDPSWPRHDFRALMVGRLGVPTAPDMATIQFPIADITDALNAPVQTSKFSSGDFDKQYKPTLIGALFSYGSCEPPKTDAATLTYTVSHAAIATPNGYGAADVNVYDNGVRVVSSNKTVSAVDAGTETITCAGHGLLADATVMFYTGTPPSPLALNTEYFVISAGLTTNDFRLSATLGGAAINLTTTTTGAKFEGYLYVVDKAAATVKLLAAPAGRVTMGNFNDNVGNYLDQVYATLIFTRIGLSPNYKDAANFSAFGTDCVTLNRTAGYWLNTEQHSGIEVLSDIAKKTATWFGPTFDGLMQIGIVALPTASPVKSLTVANVASGSLKLATVWRQRDYSPGPLFSYQPLFGNGGPINSSDKYFQQGRRIYGYSAFGGFGIPLDSYPENLDAQDFTSMDTIYMSDSGIEYFIDSRINFYKKRIGIFEFRTTLAALWHANGPLSIGDTISLEHPRLGFKQYSAADPASPDNAATIDARLAVVMGIDVNLSAPAGQQVTLKVYRQIPGYYPTANLN